MLSLSLCQAKGAAPNFSSALTSEKGLAMRQIAKGLNISRSTAHDHLATDQS
jgi:orotate phosphoribosyltransferase-like protein